MSEKVCLDRDCYCHGRHWCETPDVTTMALGDSWACPSKHCHKVWHAAEMNWRQKQRHPLGNLCLTTRKPSLVSPERQPTK
jgi:hypothetical protein